MTEWSRSNFTERWYIPDVWIFIFLIEKTWDWFKFWLFIDNWLIGGSILSGLKLKTGGILFVVFERLVEYWDVLVGWMTRNIWVYLSENSIIIVSCTYCIVTSCSIHLGPLGIYQGFGGVSLTIFFKLGLVFQAGDSTWQVVENIGTVYICISSQGTPV